MTFHTSLNVGDGVDGVDLAIRRIVVDLLLMYHVCYGYIYIYGILEPLGPGRLFPCQFFESTFGSKEEETADPEMPMEIGNQVFVKGKGRGILALDNEDGTWYLCLQ